MSSAGNGRSRTLPSWLTHGPYIISNWENSKLPTKNNVGKNNRRQSGKKLPCDKITTWPNSKVITNNWGTNNRHRSGEREVYMATNSQQESGKKLPCARNHDASVEQEVQTYFSH